MSWDSSTVSVGDPTEKSDYDRLMDNTKFLYSSDLTFTGEKTFQSATVFTVAPNFNAVGRKVENVGRSGTSTVIELRSIVFEIGDWDMSADDSVNLSTAPVPVDPNDIRALTIIIRDDSDTTHYTVPYANASGTVDVWIPNFQISVININRRTGSIFDSASFNATGFNRGWIYLEAVM